MRDEPERPPSDNIDAQTESINIGSEFASNVIAHSQSVMETEDENDWDESIEDAGVVWCISELPRHWNQSQVLTAARFLIQIRKAFPKKGSSKYQKTSLAQLFNNVSRQ
uniref:Uncharacterized protein n=1 Tax=Spongospora subterranea TaxID=70186 RepID=A0A0H5QYB8_9EUKA|eukprot:CRZ06717.1 hypothetical protein [Spongospora subterranea]